MFGYLGRFRVLHCVQGAVCSLNHCGSNGHVVGHSNVINLTEYSRAFVIINAADLLVCGYCKFASQETWVCLV